MRLVMIALAGGAMLALVLAALANESPPAPSTELHLAGVGYRAILYVRAPLASPPAMPSANGSEAMPFPTIAQAVRAAPAQAEIRIAAGTYVERLAVRRTLALVGAGASRTRLVSPAGSGAVLAIFADEVLVDGLTIEGGAVGIEISGGRHHRLHDVALRGQSRSGLRASGAELTFESGEVLDVAEGRLGEGMLIENGRLELTNTVFRRAGRRAILLRHSRARVSDVDVEGSSLSALQAVESADVEVIGGRFVGQAGAALFASASRLRVSGARIERNEMGIVAYRGAKVDVDQSQLIDHQIAGVVFNGSSGRLRGSLVLHGGSDAGIAISESRGVILEENEVVDPGSVGIRVIRSEATLRGNEVRGARRDRQRSFGDGVYALDAELLLRGNVIRANQGSGLTFTATTARLTSNDLIANGGAGLTLFNRSEVSATGNLFADNGSAGLAVFERSRANLSRNRFGMAPGPAIEAACRDTPSHGTARLLEGNTFARGVSAPAACE